MRPGPRRPWADLEAAALAQQQVVERHPHVLEQHFGVAVRRVVVAKHRQVAHDRHARRIDRHQDHRLLRGDAVRIVGSLLPMKIRILQRGSQAPEVHHFLPLITHSSPSRSILASMLVASDDATSGSVIANRGADLAGQ
jgi:hypothetical protein